MKILFLIAFTFISLSAFAQTSSNPNNNSQYQQGYNTGRSIATDCDNPHRTQLYTNTINGNYNSDYKNGVRDGWLAHEGDCLGGWQDNTGGTGSGTTGNWMCETLGLFCDVDDNNSPPGGGDE